MPSLVGGPVRMHAVFRVTRDADLWVSPDSEDLLEALETELRRRRFGEVVRLEIGADAPAEIRDLLTSRLGIESDRVYESSAPLGLAALAELAALDRPELKRERVASRDGQSVRRRRRHDAAGTDSSTRPPGPPSVRGLRHERRELRRRLAGSESRLAEGDCLPDGQPLDDSRVAHRRCGGREAGRLPRRAEGAFRRAPEHRVVAGPRTRRRPRRLRRPGPEGPRQALTARATRARRFPAVRARRHRQLPRGERVGLRRPQSLHGRRGHRRGRRGRLQRGHEPDVAAALPQAAGQPVVHARRPPPRDRAGRPEPRARAGPRGSASR